jgi:hypothetical protein
MKKTIRLTETDLKRMIAESVRNALNEGIYDYPDGIDHLIFLSENDRECYDLFWQIVQMLKKKHDKGVELSVDLLTNSSVMKKYQQFVFRKFRNEQPMITKETPYLFRKYIAEEMIERINGGEY